MSERAHSESSGVGRDEIRQQAERIASSPLFTRAPSLARLLKYLAAQAEPPKEYAIGVDVLGRGADFDPLTDTIVRVQTFNLRARLEEDYRG